jgi:hypothetical protein
VFCNCIAILIKLSSNCNHRNTMHGIENLKKNFFSHSHTHTDRAFWREWGGTVGSQNWNFGIFIYFLWLCSPARAMAPLFTRFRDHTQRRATIGWIPLDEWSARRRGFYLTTHNTHIQTSMLSVGFEPSRRAAVDLRLRPRGHWDSMCIYIYIYIYIYIRITWIGYVSLVETVEISVP